MFFCCIAKYWQAQSVVETIFTRTLHAKPKHQWLGRRSGRTTLSEFSGAASPDGKS
jgi:hypothetical protein